MKFRITLTDPANNIFQTKEFAGLVGSYLSLDRHPDFHTIQEFFNGTMHAFGKNIQIDGGREWLKNVQNILGPDAVITSLIEVDFKFRGTFETIYDGVLAVGLFIETLEDSHLLQITISQSIWWQKFIKRFESKVNIQSRGDEDGNVVIPMDFKPVTLTAQKINKSYVAYRSKNAVMPVNNVANPVLLIGWDAETLKEIDSQSSIVPSIISGGTGAAYPAPEKALPLFTFDDGGDLIIKNILLTLSEGNVFNDPNWAGVVDFTQARNGKCAGIAASFKLYVQKNEEPAVEFSAVDRSVPNSFVRNDGVVELLLINGGVPSPMVTDYTFPKDYQLKINKYDSIKIYGLYTGFFPPFTLGKSMLFVWGQDGWDHNSGFDQMRYCMGCYQKWRTGGIHDEKNEGNFSYGGGFIPTGSFPASIDNDQGIGLPIRASDWWIISSVGNCAGIPVSEINVITALVNNPDPFNPADWNIGVKTPFEGLENYAAALTNYQSYYDPSSGNFPTVRKDGVSAIQAYDRWPIASLQVNLQGSYVDSTYIIQALFNVPGNVRPNWWISTLEFYNSYKLSDLPFQGFYDASVNLYPSFMADGVSTIEENSCWIISTGGSFGGVGGVNVDALQIIRAKINIPGQVDANWDVYTLEQWQAYISETSVVYNGIQLEFQTTFIETIAQGFLLHDVGAAITDRITGRTGLFKSPLLGSPYSRQVFGDIGGFSLFALFKGLQIRGYDLIQKPFFYSMKEFWKGINNIACLAMGKYKIAGQDYIVIKKRSEVYDPTMIVKLNWVQNIKKLYNDSEQYTSAQIGYSTWQSKGGNSSGGGIATGLDDMQTVQTRNTLFKNIGKKISILSDLIAAGLAIEGTRRITNKQSANYQYDDNTFIMALTRVGNLFKPELAENFSQIDNLLNKDSRYNLRLSTFRNFMRHLNYLSGCMQKNLDSFFRFSSGEGNYKMASKATSNYLGDNPGVLLTEDQSISPSNDPIYLDEKFDIQHYLDWECYQLLRDNPDMAIGISQTDEGHVPFFYDSLKFFFAKGKVSISAKPKSEFNIKTIIAPAGNKKYYEPAYEPEYE